jgi:hypothetical protein
MPAETTELLLDEAAMPHRSTTEHIVKEGLDEARHKDQNVYTTDLKRMGFASGASSKRRRNGMSEKVELEKQTPAASLESLLEEAFEAGLACVLGEEDEQESSSETADEADLRRILLKPLMEGGSAARMMRREVLRQAIVRTMIQDIIKHAESQSGSATASKSDRAVS